MFERFIADLRLPSHHVSHQAARKKVFLLLGALVGVFTGLSMAYLGYSFIALTLSALCTCVATSMSTIIAFTQDRLRMMDWVNDMIDFRYPGEWRRYVDNPNYSIPVSAAIGLMAGLTLFSSGMSLFFAAVNTLSFFMTSNFVTMLATSEHARLSIMRWIDDVIFPPAPITIEMPRNLRENSQRLETLKNDLQNANLADRKNIAKELFNLRSNEHNLTDNAINTRINNFRPITYTELHSPEAWNNPNILNNLQNFMAQALLLSHSILAKIEQDYRQAYGPVTTGGISRILSSPQYQFNAGIVDLYHRLRARAYYDARNTLRHDGYGHHHDSQAWNNAFYQEGTPQNAARKLYNTFIKHGFYLRYGNKAFKDQLQAENALCLEWMQVDSRKTRRFNAMPGIVA